jgi:quinol monooxygenase YgiN
MNPRLGLILSLMLAFGAAPVLAQAPPSSAPPPAPQAAPPPAPNPPAAAPAPTTPPPQAASTPPAAAPAAAGPVYVVTYFEADPAMVPRVASALRRAVAQARQTDGNTGFLALRERERPGRFAIVESWRDQTAHDAHAAAAKALADQLQPFLVSPLDSRPSVPLDVGGPPFNAGAGLRAVIVVLTHVDVLPAGKDQTIDLVKALAAASRKEDGNLFFNVLQQANRGNHMTLVEAWRDRTAFLSHVVAGPTKDFRAKLTPLAGALYDERLYEVIP